MLKATVKKFKSKKYLSSREALEDLDKNELIDKILQLESHKIQLQNIIKKSKVHSKKNSYNKSQKAFDFSKHGKRHILLKFYYLGWNYDGFIEQEHTINTIEHHIFQALKRSCLIENRETSNYHCCGRTDKGVSAFSQVISLDIRSNVAKNLDTNCPDDENHQNSGEHQEQKKVNDENKLESEIEYCKILNRILPRDIQCIAWAPVVSNYSSRFDCKSRTYKYFFPRDNLDIKAMNEAAQLLNGQHDFRNLCKMDVANGVVAFERTIEEAKIVCLDQSDYDINISDRKHDSMCYLHIKGQAFLWHQIRCIMSILLLIGQNKEKPEILLNLFDIESCPSRPQYNLAHELPLNLFHCEYDDVNWIYDVNNISVIIKNLHDEWTINAVKAEMIKNMVDQLSNNLNNDYRDKIHNQADCLIPGVKSKVYQPLMSRVTCASLESRIKHYTKKRKIEIQLNHSMESKQ